MANPVGKMIAFRNPSHFGTVGSKDPKGHQQYLHGVPVFIPPGEMIVDQDGKQWRTLADNGARFKVTFASNDDPEGAMAEKDQFIAEKGIPADLVRSDGFMGAHFLLEECTKAFQESDLANTAQRVANTARLQELERKVEKQGELEEENAKLRAQLAFLSKEDPPPVIGTEVVVSEKHLAFLQSKPRYKVETMEQAQKFVASLGRKNRDIFFKDVDAWTPPQA